MSDILNVIIMCACMFCIALVSSFDRLYGLKENKMARVYTERKETVIKTYVDFYCDRCGKFMGQGEEDEDGYCPLPIEAYEVEPYFKGFGYPIELERKILCEDCCNKCETEVRSWLEDYFKFGKEENE